MLPVHSLSLVPQGTNIAYGSGLVFWMLLVEEAVTNESLTLSTPSEHHAPVITWRWSRADGVLRDRLLLIGPHCHNIQASLCRACCWISCLATHKISLLSWCPFPFISPHICPVIWWRRGRAFCLVLDLHAPLCALIRLSRMLWRSLCEK